MMTRTVPAAPQPGSRWRSRIERARDLRTRYAPAAPVLDFYARVLEFQQQVAASAPRPDPISNLRSQLDLSLAARHLPDLLSLTIASGPPLLAERAGSLQHAGERFFESPPSDALNDFFFRASLQPIAEMLQLGLASDPNYHLSSCPACGARPQAAVLRPEGDGAARWLMCSLCLREWLYRRVVCPWCAQEDKEKLPRYSAPECGQVRVEACDSCRRYLKAVDLTSDGHAIPLVDEAAAGVLDLWATQNGYTKIALNLMGL